MLDLKYRTMILNELLARLGQLQSHFQTISTRSKNLILLIAFVLLSVGVYISISDNPEVLRKANWDGIWAILLVGVPLTILLNALEFILSGRMISVSIAPIKALEVTIIGSAVNMLPLPGSTMVRIAALKLSGAGYKKSTVVTLLFAIVWIGAAFLLAGLVLGIFFGGILGYFMAVMGLAALIIAGMVTRNKKSTVVTLLFAIVWIGAAFLLAGLVLSIFFGGILGYFLAVIGLAALIIAGMATRNTKNRWKNYIWLLALKFCMVMLDAVRIYWCFWALDIEVNLPQASVFVISSVVGSAASIVPAGLGVRELISAGIAPFVGIAASAGFLTATLNRIVGLSALLPMAGFLILLGRMRAA
jgi:uncharacterized membrane protein YbhN (UPF0104 family)